MKRCPRCGQLKSESEFYKNARMKDGLTIHCKNCHKNMCYETVKTRKMRAKQEENQKQLDDFNYHLGGYRITILNYAKPNEYKYIITPTNRQSFMTNDNAKFISKIKELING